MQVEHREPLKEMPNPTEADLASPEFEAIWQVIKHWDIAVPPHYELRCGGNGSHVKMILDALVEIRAAQ